MKSKDSKRPSENTSWRSRKVIEISIAIGGIVAINAIFIAKVFRETDTVSATAAGQLGDFVGGYVGTGFLLISILLLYATLKSQRCASQLQSFELRFFELVKMHRDNVAEMQLQETTGRRVFVLLCTELWAITEIVRYCAARLNLTLDQLQVLRISYYCLFYGVGEVSSPMLKHALGDIDQDLFKSIDKELQSKRVCDRVKKDYTLGYHPFSGHQSRLGHYYRHLYQSVRYVDQQTLEINKYEYVKTLRAQLTTHEQVLLLVNSLTPIGQKWWSQGLIQEYRMVKNLPRHFMDTVLDVEAEKLFTKGYFEWEEATEK